MSYKLLYGFPSGEGLGVCDKRLLRLFVIQSGAKRSEESREHPLIRLRFVFRSFVSLRMTNASRNDKRIVEKCLPDDTTKIQN